jgi:protein-disulfide isomerase
LRDRTQLYRGAWALGLVVFVGIFAVARMRMRGGAEAGFPNAFSAGPATEAATLGITGVPAGHSDAENPLLQSPPPRQAHAHASAPEALAPPSKTFGSKSAPITMEVWSDYQCPACRGLFEQALRPMINDYVAAGKVYLIHRDFPLGLAAHTHAYEAARWANAAGQIGKFAQVDAALFDNQNNWSADGNIAKYLEGALVASDFKHLEKIMAGPCMVDPGPVTTGVNLAAQGGKACSVDAYIEEDKKLGNQVPVTQTPTYVFTHNGQRLPPGAGGLSWPILKQFLDSLLAQ